MLGHGNKYAVLLIALLTSATGTSEASMPAGESSANAISKEETILKREYPPYLHSMPTLLAPLGDIRHRKDNLLGIGCSDGSFYIICPASNRYFMSRSMPAAGRIYSMIPFLSQGKDDSYFLAADRYNLYLFNWQGKELRKVEAHRMGGAVTLVEGPSLAESFAFDKLGVFKITAQRGARNSLSIKKIHSGKEEMLDLKYCKSTNRLMIRTRTGMFMMGNNGRISSSSSVPMDPIPFSGVPKEFGPILRKCWRGVRSVSCIAERGDSAYYFYNDYSRTGSCWLVKRLVMKADTLIPSRGWKVEIPGTIHDMIIHGNDLFLASGDIDGDMMSENSFIYRIDALTGEVLAKKKMYQPPMYLANWGSGIAAICFRLHVILYNYRLDQLGIDHASMFPTAFLAMDMNNDGTKDLVVGGVKYWMFSKSAVENLRRYMGVEINQVALTSGSKADIRYAVDCYINRYGSILNSIDAAVASGGEALRRRDYAAGWDDYARARGLYAVLKERRKVDELNILLRRVNRTQAFAAGLPLFLLVSFVVGGTLATCSRTFTIVKFTAGFLVVVFIVKMLNILGRIQYYPVLSFALGFIIVIAYFYVRATLTSTRAINAYQKILLNKEAFTHGGGGSRIFDSLKLLLGNAKSMQGREEEFYSLLRDRVGAFKETCEPRLLELADLMEKLPLVKPKEVDLQRCMERTRASLRLVLSGEKTVIERSDGAYNDLVRCEAELQKLFEWIKRYPACDVAGVAKKAWNKTAFTGKGDFLFFIRKSGADPIAFFPEMDLAFILENLFENAGRHLKSLRDPAIEITIYRRFNRVVLKYKDNGPGFDNEQVQSIAGGIRNADGHGRGLALSIEKVKRYGGDMAIRPSTKGAYITIKFLAFGSRGSKRYV